MLIYLLMPKTSFGCAGLLPQLLTKRLDGSEVLRLRMDVVHEDEEVASLDAVHVIQAHLIGGNRAVLTDEHICKALCMPQISRVTRGAIQLDEGTCHQRGRVFPFGLLGSVALPQPGVMYHLGLRHLLSQLQIFVRLTATYEQGHCCNQHQQPNCHSTIQDTYLHVFAITM